MAGAVLGLRLRALRWVLPVMLVFGVCLMHTLGHLTSGHGAAVHEGMGPSARVAAEPVPVVAAVPVPVQAPGAMAAVGPVVAGAGVGFDPMAVCLAVLTSVLVLVLAMVAVRGSRRASYSGGGTGVAGGVARAPPRRTVASLSELSVMRT